MCSLHSQLAKAAKKRTSKKHIICTKVKKYNVADETTNNTNISYNISLLLLCEHTRIDF